MDSDQLRQSRVSNLPDPNNFHSGSDDEDGSNGDSSPEERWDLDEYNKMDFVCAFLDNEEDSLPDFFDVNQVQQIKTDNCSLCEKVLSNYITAGKASKKHYCKKCGITVCMLCSQSPKRRLCKMDKKKYRVCDTCDTLMSNTNFEQMYKNCLEQQVETLAKVKKSLNTKEMQVKKINGLLEKQRKLHEKKGKEVEEKRVQKEERIEKKEQSLQSKRQEYEELKAKLGMLDKMVEERDNQIVDLQRSMFKKKEEKRSVENKRKEKEDDLHLENQKLYQVQMQEYDNSFKDNKFEAVEDVERQDWRDDDTSFDEESYSLKEKHLHDALRNNNH